MQLHDVFIMPLGLFLSRGIHCLKLVLQEFKSVGRVVLSEIIVFIT